MKVLEFGGYLGLGGTEKATCRWSIGLKQRGHEVSVLAMRMGPRARELEEAGIPVLLCPWDRTAVAQTLASHRPDVIHLHAPGVPAEVDVIGEALLTLPRIPVVQTNIFGHLENPREDAWTDFRLFISWTSCVQAARRSFLKLDREFFRKASVAVYPLDPEDAPPAEKIRCFREGLGIGPQEVLFGRLSRPEPNKWTELPLDAFRRALKKTPQIKLLLREPPPLVAQQLRNAPDADRFVILPATSDPAELRLTLASLDAVLHTSSIGESFGYGIAEPMNLGKPVVTNSVPWGDQAQIELVRHGECGFIASTPASMAEAVLKLAADPGLRKQFGEQAVAHIHKIADVEISLDRLEKALYAVVEGRENPLWEEDLKRARAAADDLDQQQFGHGWREQFALRPFYYRVRFNQWRRVAKARIFS